MSSVQVVTARRDKSRYQEIEKQDRQIASESRYYTLNELDEINDIIARYPITVERNRFQIDSNHLEIGKIYRFEYLESQMVLWKNVDGSVDLYEIVE